MARNTEKREKWEMHILGPVIWRKNCKRWKIRNAHCRTWVYYKNLDYYYVEKRYESGKVIGETVMEEAPYSNKQSMWYEEGEGNQELFP